MEHYEFASDNTAGLAPEALAAIVEANADCCGSYGEDVYTERARAAFSALFERPCRVFFVSTGTAANALAIAQLCRSHHGVICHQAAHIETDECGAPGFFNGGVKLLTASGDNGKITPAAVAQLATNRRDVHSSKPRVLSLTSPTEWGTVYSLQELAALRAVAASHGLRIHLDGARFSNGVASLGCAPGAVIEASGADILCFGGSKGGLGWSEAVVFFDLELADEFDYRCKQAGQLASKMRLLSAPWAPMLNEGHWLRYAHRANQATHKLAAAFRQLELEPASPVQANATFVRFPEAVSQALRDKGWHFYDFAGAGSRFMCSWKTDEAAIHALIGDLKEALRAHSPAKQGRKRTRTGSGSNAANYGFDGL